jgi:antiviral helicase SLH1
MQSLVYPVAYKTNENMLICAPTGAGKTDAAMLTILQTVAKYMVSSSDSESSVENIFIEKNDFKIVYVAPMKALAAEITGKLGKRLKWLDIAVRELTGDMHLTKHEIVETQIIVTTPEKWDVVTRKGTGDTELVQKVRLLIIDEVHMLHDSRGAVLESLVARTQRQVESTQSLIRIVGLSATLPNYVDVADFLKVNRYAGLFYFDSSFRPVPLEQHFIGVKGKAGTKTSRENLDNVSFEKVKLMLEAGHQVMVFVHSRKDTLATARLFRKMAMEQKCLELLDPSGHEKYNSAQVDMKTSKSRELNEIFKQGFGIHHAGMARSDRNLMEKVFGDGVIKVLCCTATLAWGVNLPAAAVVIKGTQIYSAQEGKFVDLGILDVLQIFGRAGRPQFQDTGIGFICTTLDKLPHYVSAVTQQHPIESQFVPKLVDNLNAEIALGTVTTVQEGVQWLGYSYMFVRMRRNPLNYGIEWSEYQDDPQLVQRRRALIISAARVLRQSQMISFDNSTEEFRSREIGRIASQFYVLQNSIDLFNQLMQPLGGEADMFTMLSKSSEFDNIQSRDSEYTELSLLKKDSTFCEIGGTVDQTETKTNILLQAFISRARLEDFALVSDSSYVAQNASRLCRSIFMIALHRRWGNLAQVMLSICKSIDKRAWSFRHPLSQFDLPHHIIQILEADERTSNIESLGELTAEQMGEIVRNPRMGKTLRNLVDNFPLLDVSVSVAPVNHDVLRVTLVLVPGFKWNIRHHGGAESYWIFVENAETSEIYHHEYFVLSLKKFAEHREMVFTIPLPSPVPSELYVRSISDRWLGAETITGISLKDLVIPETKTNYTELKNLELLHVSALNDPILEEIYSKRSQFFNPMQTQIFNTLYESSTNVLLGSPTGSGKTTAAELAIWRAFKEHPGTKVVYIAPMKALVRERLKDWTERLGRPLGLKIVELTGDFTPDTRLIRDSNIIIATPEKWDGVSRNWQQRDYVRQVSLIIFDEIHLLGGDRGPVLEMIVSRMNHLASVSELPVRLLGMSTASANAEDVADWLGASNGLFNFRNSVRPVPLEIFVEGFPDQAAFSTLMQTMNRPAFLAIKAHSPEKSVLIFVASRKQTRLTAKDLINFCGMEENPRRFVRMTEDELELHMSRTRDLNLKESLAFGIGLHHAGMAEADRLLAEELFSANKLQVLIATSTLAWGVNLPAHMVIIKGTQYFDARSDGYRDMDLTDVLQMLGRAGRPQFDTSGVALVFTKDSQRSFYQYFLHTGFPIESSLHRVLDDHLGAEIASGVVKSVSDAVKFLSYTFFARRLPKNPSYYGYSSEMESLSLDKSSNTAFLEAIVTKSIQNLVESKCVVETDNQVKSTPFGKIASHYYLSHKTIRRSLDLSEPNITFEKCLAIFCNAAEFDELPVRHNEDAINQELARLLPGGSKHPSLLPTLAHQKAYLLSQAYLSRLDLPIADYVGDLNSMLEQSIRILQAMVDTTVELNNLSGCLQVISLLQCIKSSRWPEDSGISILPGVKSQRGRLMKNLTSPIPSLGEIAKYKKSELDLLAKEFGVNATAKVCLVMFR